MLVIGGAHSQASLCVCVGGGIHCKSGLLPVFFSSRNHARAVLWTHTPSHAVNAVVGGMYMHSYSMHSSARHFLVTSRTILCDHPQSDSLYIYGDIIEAIGKPQKPQLTS